MSLGEWLTIPVVIALSMTFSVIYGVFAGLLMGCIHFVWSYAVRPPIRACYLGDVAVSQRRTWSLAALTPQPSARHAWAR